MLTLKEERRLIEMAKSNLRAGLARHTVEGLIRDEIRRKQELSDRIAGWLIVGVPGVGFTAIGIVWCRSMGLI